MKMYVYKKSFSSHNMKEKKFHDTMDNDEFVKEK